MTTTSQRQRDGIERSFCGAALGTGFLQGHITARGGSLSGGRKGARSSQLWFSHCPIQLPSRRAHENAHEGNFKGMTLNLRHAYIQAGKKIRRNFALLTITGKKLPERFLITDHKILTLEISIFKLQPSNFLPITPRL